MILLTLALVFGLATQTSAAPKPFEWPDLSRYHYVQDAQLNAALSDDLRAKVRLYAYTGMDTLEHANQKWLILWAEDSRYSDTLPWLRGDASGDLQAEILEGRILATRNAKGLYYVDLAKSYRRAGGTHWETAGIFEKGSAADRLYEIDHVREPRMLELILKHNDVPTADEDRRAILSVAEDFKTGRVRRGAFAPASSPAGVEDPRADVPSLPNARFSGVVAREYAGGVRIKLGVYVVLDTSAQRLAQCRVFPAPSCRDLERP
ncbi:MAG: hypothetical protein HY078_17395 [Elusimicrobia bacterium]|nr:hypothetical protein [Elusimicrobiota bacterium]